MHRGGRLQLPEPQVHQEDVQREILEQGWHGKLQMLARMDHCRGYSVKLRWTVREGALALVRAKRVCVASVNETPRAEYLA